MKTGASTFMPKVKGTVGVTSQSEPSPPEKALQRLLPLGVTSGGMILVTKVMLALVTVLSGATVERSYWKSPR